MVICVDLYNANSSLQDLQSLHFEFSFDFHFSIEIVIPYVFPALARKTILQYSFMGSNLGMCNYAHASVDSPQRLTLCQSLNIRRE